MVLSLRPRTAVQQDIGAWIHLPYSTLSVPPHGATEVPFTIDPPQQAAPGDHVGGIVAENIQGTTSKSGSVPVTVIQAVGVRVYGRVVGPLHPGLTLPQLSLLVRRVVATESSPRTSSCKSLSPQFRQYGLSPIATVLLTTPVGTGARKSFVVNEILPWQLAGVQLGIFWAEYLRSPAGSGLRNRPRSERERSDHGVDTIPWGLLVLVALAVISAMWIVVRRRRLRRSRARPSEIASDESSKGDGCPCCSGTGWIN